MGDTIEITASRIAVDLINSFSELAKELNQSTDYNYDLQCALKVAESTRDNIPMYTGLLNPKWKLWSDVVKCIVDELKELG